MKSFLNYDTDDEKSCAYNDHSETSHCCEKISWFGSNSDWVCTRPYNHDGKHEARNSKGACARWNDDEKESLELIVKL